MIKISAGPACFLVLLLSACTVGPDFVRPKLPEPAWHAALPHGGKVENLAQWWDRMDDPLLTQLILAAEKDSPTLNMALAKVEEARAEIALSRAPALPQGGLSGTMARSKSVFGNQVLLQNNVRTGFDAGWELDLFGGNRRSQESAHARFGAADRTWHDARISLAAEVADSYVELRTCQASLVLLEKNLTSLTVTQQLIELRQKAGFATAVDTARSNAAQSEAFALLESKKGDCSHSINRLSAITGIELTSLHQMLSAGIAQIPEIRAAALDNIAANALRQRPDVATAEFNLAAASADIGVARAESYPGLTLMGSVGINSISTGDTRTRASTWSFSPSLSIPVWFDGGKRNANRNAADARYHYALAVYQQTVRVAVREIEDTLVRLDVATRRLAQSRETLAQYQKIFNNSEARSKVGMSSQLDKEEAIRTELQGRETVLQNQRENVSSWIAVYKALGGGWQDNAMIMEKNNEIGK